MRRAIERAFCEMCSVSLSARNLSLANGEERRATSRMTDSGIPVAVASCVIVRSSGL